MLPKPLRRLPLRMNSQPVGLALACALAIVPLSGGLGQSPAGSHSLTQQYSSIRVQFDTLPKAPTNDANRIDQIFWRNDYNIAANEPSGRWRKCGDPVEFFGESEGYPNTAMAPVMVTGGQRASWSLVMKPFFSRATTYTGVATCPSVHEDGLTRTFYELSDDFFLSLRVERTFRFRDGLGHVANIGLRGFVPRVQDLLHYVLVPDASGNIVTYDAHDCASNPCRVKDWNGKWFADDDGDGDGMIVVRDPSSTVPAFLAIQSGGISKSNFTSMVLVQPKAGWSGLVTETEYLCFYNFDTWDRSNVLPTGCTPQTASNQAP